ARRVITEWQYQLPHISDNASLDCFNLHRRSVLVPSLLRLIRTATVMTGRYFSIFQFLKAGSSQTLIPAPEGPFHGFCHEGALTPDFRVPAQYSSAIAAMLRRHEKPRRITA